jgi:hypothetical protein
VVINCHNMQVKKDGGRGRSGAGAAGCGGARPGGAGEGKGMKREREVPTGGPQLSATQQKRKKRRERWAVAGRGLAGRWAGRAER